jgi:hypothetical protein
LEKITFLKWTVSRIRLGEANKMAIYLTIKGLSGKNNFLKMDSEQGGRYP